MIKSAGMNVYGSQDEFYQTKIADLDLSSYGNFSKKDREKILLAGLSTREVENYLQGQERKRISEMQNKNRAEVDSNDTEAVEEANKEVEEYFDTLTDEQRYYALTIDPETYDSFDDFKADIEEWTNKENEIKFKSPTLKEIQEEVNKIQESIDFKQEALDEYNENGELSEETFLQLKDSEYKDYVAYIDGKFVILEGFNKLIEAEAKNKRSLVLKNLLEETQKEKEAIETMAEMREDALLFRLSAGDNGLNQTHVDTIKNFIGMQEKLNTVVKDGADINDYFLEQNEIIIGFLAASEAIGRSMDDGILSIFGIGD